MALSIWPKFIGHKNTYPAPISTRAKSSEVFVKPTARPNSIARSRAKPSQVFPLSVKASMTSDRSTKPSGLFCMMWRLCKKPRLSVQPRQESVVSVNSRSREESARDEPQLPDSRSKHSRDSSAVQQISNNQPELSEPVTASTQDQEQGSASNTAHQHSIPFAPRDAEQFDTHWDNMDSDSDSDAFSLASQVSDDDPDEAPRVRPAVIIRTVVSSQKIQQVQYAEWAKQNPHGTSCEPSWPEYLARHEGNRKIDFRSFCAAIDKRFPELEREMIEKLRAIDNRLGVCREHANGGRKGLKKIQLSLNMQELGSEDVKGGESMR